MHVIKNLKPLKRWGIHCGVFWNVSRDSVKRRWVDALELMAADGVTGPKAWMKLAWYLLGHPGVLRKISRMGATFFLPGFHPWMHDDRNLLAKAKAELAQAPAVAA